MSVGEAKDQIAIRRPDDWRVHLRDGAMLQADLPYTAAQFARAIVMPNLVPPVTTVARGVSACDRRRLRAHAGRSPQQARTPRPAAGARAPRCACL